MEQRGRRRRHLADVPDQGRARSATGSHSAVARARETGAPAVFWLDETRAHDAQVLRQGPARARASSTPTACRSRSSTSPPRRRLTLERARNGLDTISVTGNVLRDYLTDLFPILELGTSAKMLSIVPLVRRRRAVRDRRRRLGPQARAAVPAREPPAVGLARRVPGARAFVDPAGRTDRQPARPVAGRHAGPRDGPRTRGQPVSVAQGRRARQPRQPLLPRALLGPGAGRPDRGRGAGPTVRPARPRRSPTTSSRSSTSCTRRRAPRWTSTATTGPTSTR